MFEVKWTGDSAHLTYSNDRTTYAERGMLHDDSTFIDVPIGTGHVLYFSAPLELADQLDEIGRVYSICYKAFRGKCSV